MALNEEYLQRACEAFDAVRGAHMNHRTAVIAAIEKYLAEMFKPGEMMTLEPCVPARDYRKELWIGIRLQDADIAQANAALADFDATFPPEPNHG